MGAGDWLMAAGEARAIHAKNGLPALVVDRRMRPQWHPVFENNPYILQRRPVGSVYLNQVVSASGQRPYIRLKTPGRWLWEPYKPRPAELFFTDAERDFAEPYRGMVMVEPHVKPNGHSNKAWPMQRWQELVDRLDLPWGQCAPHGTPTLANVMPITTPTFRYACAVLSVCKAFVGAEGGLMHAAAATKTPAVILWSEFISPAITGYPTMVNLRHAGPPCGMRVDCRTCRVAMNKITVTEVVAALKGVLK